MKNEIIELKLDFTKFPIFLQILIKWIQMRTGAAVEMILSTALGVMALACQDRLMLNLRADQCIQYHSLSWFSQVREKGSQRYLDY